MKNSTQIISLSLRSLNETREIVKQEIKKLFEADFSNSPGTQHNSQTRGSNKMIGYKVMRYEDGKLISGANSRIRFKPEIGKTITMPENGVFLSPKKQYVIDYYSGLSDQEALLTFEFDVDDIISGNLEDREPELGVRRVKLVDIEVLE